jgi:transposase
MSALDKLAKLLTKTPLTGKQIAKRMRCSKPTAYAWIALLRERGHVVYELAAPTAGTSGPVPTAFGVR